MGAPGIVQGWRDRPAPRGPEAGGRPLALTTLRSQPHRATFALALALTFVVARAAPAPAANKADDDPDVRRYNRGLYAYQFGDLRGAVVDLAEVLYPTPQIKDPEVRVAAYQLLGACQFLLGDRDGARKAFLQAQTVGPDVPLDAFLFPPAVVEFFDQVRAEVEAAVRAAATAGQRPPGEMEPETGRVQVVERRIQERLFLVNFLPFGIGQFQNGRHDWGLLFLVTQAVMLVVNVASAAAVEGLRDGTTGRFPGRDYNRARALRATQLTAAGLFAGLYAWGVTDAILGFEPRTETLVPRAPDATAPAGGAAPRLDLLSFELHF